MIKKNKKSKSQALPKIVCLGGGNAMPKAVLTGIKKHPVNISVICAMLDSGGSAGRLRKDYKIISPGDIRRAFIALANASPVVESLFNYRFEAGALKGHNFANLLITALELSTKNNYDKVCDEMCKILNIQHRILPVTLDNSNLYAVLENGKVIKGETNIDIPKHNGKLKIKRVFLRPKAKAYPKSVKAIKEADIIVIGPGDLYSSLAQILLVKGIPEAIKKSQAKKVYICNLMTKYGETNNFKVLGFASQIEDYLDCKLDYIIYNTKKPLAKRLALNRKMHPEEISPVQIDKEISNKKFIGSNIITNSGEIVHDPKKLAKVILSLL
jgi:uncharacterized cofD-like protein